MFTSIGGTLKQHCPKCLRQIIVLISIAGFFLIISAFFLKIVIVNGSSMSPTLENGQMVLVKPNEKNISCGDIVVFNARNVSDTQEFWIKRVIGIGGDIVEINYEENTVTVNDELLSEPYINQEDDDPMWSTAGIRSETYTVPDGYFFVMGDNRNHSTDSRSKEVGQIPREWIIGKVIEIPFQKQY